MPGLIRPSPPVCDLNVPFPVEPSRVEPGRLEPLIDFLREIDPAPWARRSRGKGGRGSTALPPPAPGFFGVFPQGLRDAMAGPALLRGFAPIPRRGHVAWSWQALEFVIRRGTHLVAIGAAPPNRGANAPLKTFPSDLQKSRGNVVRGSGLGQARSRGFAIPYWAVTARAASDTDRARRCDQGSAWKGMRTSRPSRCRSSSQSPPLVDAGRITRALKRPGGVRAKA